MMIYMLQSEWDSPGFCEDCLERWGLTGASVKEILEVWWKLEVDEAGSVCWATVGGK